MKRTRGSTGRFDSRRHTASEQLPEGQKLRDVRMSRSGVVLDYACQYSHPKAAPVYSYLVRWDDGQIQAISEGAFAPGQGVELAD
jgi:hypothetical protein